MKVLLPKFTVGITLTVFTFIQLFFESSRPLAATTNTGVVMGVVDTEGHESKYYGIIKT
jgi:hypothetical protein